MNQEVPELYRRYRPTKLSEIIGQTSAVEEIKAFARGKGIPHVTLLKGPTGTGKTTIGRMIAAKLIGCPASNVLNHRDFHEVDSGDARKIDNVRAIRKVMGMAPIEGNARVWLLDEVHAIKGDAATCLLKMLEDTPSHVYFILCTTHAESLLKAIQNRCTPIRLEPISTVDLVALVIDVSAKEEKPVSEEVAERIAEHSEGAARKALTILQSIIDVEEEDLQLSMVASAAGAQAGALAKTIFQKGSSWADVKQSLNELRAEDPEGLRRSVLGYAQAVLLGKGDAKRAADVIEVFADNVYDSGFPGLCSRCYEVMR